jgi:hypothetical protein
MIEIYDNALNKKECDMLIDQFEKSRIIKGITSYKGVTTADDTVKKCKEVSDCRFSNNSRISHLLQSNLVRCINRYADKYEALSDISIWKYDDCYTFQKYETEDDGFKKWHCEHGVKEDSNRILVWMFYINDAKSGTEFMYHSNVKAKRGRCVIWPAGWEYMHRSVPNKGVKYIISGWASYVE